MGNRREREIVTCALQKRILELLEKDDYPLKTKELSDILNIPPIDIIHAINGLLKSKRIESSRRNLNSPCDFFIRRERKKSYNGINGYRDLTKIEGVTERNGAFFRHGIPVTVQELV